jgi:hypothetical protein
LPYYRGIALSLVEDIVVKVDGEDVPRETIKFSAHDNTIHCRNGNRSG